LSEGSYDAARSFAEGREPQPDLRAAALGLLSAAKKALAVRPIFANF
jgi:hypothetical protein